MPNQPDMVPLVVAGAVLVVVIVLMDLVAVWRTNSADRGEPLAIPRGSVRSLVSILIIGGFVSFLFFGSAAVAANAFDKILAAFATLAGAVTGFYFGGRAAAPPQPSRAGQAVQPASGASPASQQPVRQGATTSQPGQAGQAAQPATGASPASQQPGGSQNETATSNQGNQGTT